MSRRVVLACALLFVVQSMSRAQIIFEPVRYQYGGDYKFYYGGSDPYVIERALDVETRCGRKLSAEVMPLRVYSDAFPNHNAALYGCTIADARNEAYNNVPRSFRMGDLLNAAVPQNDGTWVVPANAQPTRLVIVPATRKVQPTSAPKRILIIPKDLLDRKLLPQGDLVAVAR